MHLRKRSRIITILLLPIIVFVFIIGWAMYWIGKQRSDTNSKPPSTAKDADTNEEDGVKIGVIEELMEKQLKTEQ
jgi:flagellar basal body-associated protein FliL